MTQTNPWIRRCVEGCVSKFRAISARLALQFLWRGWGAWARVLGRPESLNRPVDLLIYDPLFTPFYQGHSYQLILFFHALADALGVRMCYVGSVADRAIDAQKTIETVSWLKGSVMIQGYGMLDMLSSTHQVMRLGHSTAQDLSGIVNSHHVKCLLLPNATPWLIHGLVLWSQSLPVSDRPALIVGLLVWDSWMSRDRDQSIFDQLTDDLCALAANTRLDVYVETNTNQALLESHCPGVSIHRFPYFAASRAGRITPMGSTQERFAPVFGLMGRFGVASLNHPDVYATVYENSHDSIHWVIQTSRLKQRDSVTQAPMSQNGHGRIRWLSNDITDEEYYQAFATLTCVVMVFPKGHYTFNGSGIFYEALLGRKILVLPSECGLVNELDGLDYPFVTYDQSQTGSFASAIATVTEAHDDLVQQASAAVLPTTITESAAHLGTLIRSHLALTD